VEQEILKMIKEFKTIIIHRHVRPDPDAIGAQCGLKEILKASFPEKEVYSVGSVVKSLEFLGKMDQCVDSNLYRNSLVIVVDTASRARVSDERYDNGYRVIKIDHHPNDDPYGDLLWVDKTASSVSEMVARFFLEFKDELKMTPAAARLLYAGIVGDTGRFLYPSTTSETLAIASFLIKFGFDATALNRKLLSIPMKVAKLSGYVYQNIEVDEFGAAYVLLSANLLKKHEVIDSETSSLVSLPGEVKEVVSWAIFVEQNDGDYRVRLRSKEPVINEIAKRHGGGGHLLASGATAKNREEVLEIYNEIKEVVKKWRIKKMSLPACPQCGSKYTYEDGSGLIICPECAYEWNPAEQKAVEDNSKIKDSVGNVLTDGDTVVTVQDLPVKGMPRPIKKGTKVKNIRLVDPEINNGHDIDAKVEGFGSMGLKSSVVKKV